MSNTHQGNQGNTNKEILEQITKLSNAIQNHKKRFASTNSDHSGSSSRPMMSKISKNKSLVVQNDKSFISQGNKLTRVGLEKGNCVTCKIYRDEGPEPPKKKIKKIKRPSKNISLIQKDGQSFTRKGNSLYSSDLKKKITIKGLEFQLVNKKLIRLNGNKGIKTPKSIIANGKKFLRSKKGNLVYVKNVTTKRGGKQCSFYRFGMLHSLLNDEFNF